MIRSRFCFESSSGSIAMMVSMSLKSSSDWLVIDGPRVNAELRVVQALCCITMRLCAAVQFSEPVIYISLVAAGDSNGDWHWLPTKIHFTHSRSPRVFLSLWKLVVLRICSCHTRRSSLDQPRP